MNDSIESHISFKDSSMSNNINERDSSKSAPWLSESTLGIKNLNFRLHNEIIEFYEYIKPNPKEHERRISIFESIRTILESNIKGAEVMAFGSFCTQLYLPGSDIDLVILNDRLTEAQLYRRTRKVIKECPYIFTNVTCVTTARVPIIKFTHLTSGIDFDIAFNQKAGIINTKEIKKALVVHQELKYIFLTMKLFLRQRHLNSTYTGGIGSFLLFCMILAFLRNFKQKIYRQTNCLEKVDNLTLADYLINFLHFYGNFNILGREIQITNGGSLSLKTETSFSFDLYSPIDPGMSIGAQAFKIKEVFSAFRNRHKILTNKQFKESASVLVELVNPMKKDFQRYLA